MAARFQIRFMRSGEERACEQIMRGLSEWFGIEDAIIRYVNSIRRGPTLIAAAENEPIGFLTVREHNAWSSEIEVMAVRADRRGGGVGRALVEEAERVLRERGCQLFHVKTLATSRPDAHYEQTRRFYARMGFLPLEENRLWGEENPCLMLVKAL